MDQYLQCKTCGGVVREDHANGHGLWHERDGDIPKWDFVLEDDMSRYFDEIGDELTAIIEVRGGVVEAVHNLAPCFTHIVVDHDKKTAAVKGGVEQ